MNATEARKRRGGATLVERVKAADPARAVRIERLVAEASLEQIVQAIMESKRITAAELARRLNAKSPQISRDLHGGLSRATVSRLSSIADALGYDFIPAFVPRSNGSRRKRFLEMYRALIPESALEHPLSQHNARTKKNVPAKKTAARPAKRRVA